MRSFFTKILFCLLLITSVITADAQVMTNYTGANFTAVSGTYTPITGSTDLLGNSGSVNDDGVSAAVQIPFVFYLNGRAYTHFAACVNGWIRLGQNNLVGSANPVALSSTFTNALGNVSNTQLVTPMWDDLYILGNNNDKVHYVVTGTAPNRVLTVEWFDVKRNGSGGTIQNFQCKLHESTGVIIYSYGNCVAPSSTSASCGFTNNIGGSGNYVSVNDFTTSATVSTTTASDAITGTATNGLTFTFTPPQAVVADPANLSFTAVTLSGMTVNWEDNSSNETNFNVFRSTDGVNYTYAATVTSTTVAGTGTAYNYVATGLNIATLYYWRIVANTEGVPSGPLGGSQSTNSCSLAPGTYSVGPTGTYASITAALTDINLNGLNGAVVLELQAAYISSVETFPIMIGALPCLGVTNTLTIRPEPGATALSITSAATSTFDINGGKYVTIDGRPGGLGAVKELTVSNTSTSGIAVRFINEASNNILTYCTVTGVNTSTTSGVIVFSTTTGTNGNDNNTITNCDIRDGATTPTNAIYASGSTASVAQNNSDNTVSNNNIYNFFSASLASNGMNILGGNTDWTISGNSFYQTAARTITAGAQSTGILISNSTSGNNFTITNNFIGGSAPGATGTWTLGGAFATRYVGIQMSLGTTTASSIQGNTIANITQSSTSGATGMPGVFGGIYISAGSANIGTVSANTIGSGTGNGSISVTSSTTGAISMGIGSASSGAVNISQNIVGSINLIGSTASIGHGFNGIWATAGSALIINNNTVGSTVTANSINAVTAASGAQSVMGIQVSSGVTLPTTISGNTVANMNQAGTSTTSLIRGISYAGSGFGTITSNTINNISGANTNVTVAGGATAVIGIVYTGSSTTGALVSMNTINAISATNTGAVSTVACGIGYSNPTAGTVTRNRIYDIRNASTGTTVTAPPMAIGLMIRIANTDGTFANNMISLGNGQTTNTQFVGIINNFVSNTVKVYYNSVNIEGTAGGGALPSFCFLRGDNSATAVTSPVDVRNNIFTNTRTGGTGKHYAISNNYGATVSVTGWGANASNYNVLNANAATLGFWTTDQTFASWKTASTSDANSLSAVTVTYTNSATADLHLNMGVTPTQLESGGTVIAAVTTDFDNDARPGPAGSVNGGAFAPDFGADEFDGVPLDLTAPSIVYTPLTFTCDGSVNRTLTTTITDASGVPTAGIGLPVLYWRINAGAWTPVTATFVSGSTYTFSFGAGAVNPDIIQYYVVAQDNAATPNIGAFPSAGAAGFTADPPAAATPPTTPGSYTISNTLSGTYSVGGGGDYATLTDAVAAYNNSCLGGAVVFNLIDATYPSETFPISINNNPDASTTNTLTIKPNTTAAITGAASANALIRFNGANYVTIDGSNAGSTDRSLTIENTSVTTPQVIRIGSIGTTPVVSNALKNCIIINGINSSSAITVYDITGVAGYFNNITIQNNDIQKALIGVFANAVVTGTNGSGLLITQNKLDNTGANAIRNVGIYVQGASGATVSQNTIGNLNNADGENDYGIWLAAGTGNTTVSGNTVSNLGMTLTTTFAPYGIRESSGLAASGNNINGNMVSNISTSGSTQVFGIENSSGGTIIQQNNVQGIMNNNTTTYGAYGINVSAGNNVVIKNNFVSNVLHNMTGGGAFSTTFGVFGIRLGAGTGHQVHFNSVNLYGALTGTPTTSLLSSAFALVSTASTGCDVRNNIFANNITGGTTSIAQVAAYLPTGGTSAMNLTWNNNAYFCGTDAARQGIGQAGTTAGTNFYLASNFNPAVTTGSTNFRNYTSTLRPANTSNDSASLAFTTAVPFISANDLHINPTSNCNLDGAGTPIAGITTDYDSQVRDVTTPDIGADEYTSTYGPALAGIAGSAVCESKSVSLAGTTFTTNACNIIAKVTPSGGDPVGGRMKVCVTLDATQQFFLSEPYVQRHFDIEPVISNQSTTSATAVLYFTDAEFVAYNSNNPLWPALPTVAGGGNGDPNIGNLKVTQFHGTPTGGLPTPTPGNYTGTRVLLAPVSVVLNGTIWEVTINITGFSGFYVHSKIANTPLPITVNYFNGTKQGSNHLLNWKVTCNATPTVTMILERSADSRNFTGINSTIASAARCNQPFDHTDAAPLKGMNYYRLKMVDADGKVTYSAIVALLNAVKGFEMVNIAPNPVVDDNFKLNVTSTQSSKMEITIIDLQGRSVYRQSVNIIAGFNSIPVQVANLAAGTYTIQGTMADERSRVIRFVKQ